MSMSAPISNVNMQAMITRMRMMAAQISPEQSGGSAAVQGPSFTDALSHSLQKVNELQSIARDKSQAFELGEDISITEVMLAKEKASIAFEATLQVRNKVISAYQEIMQMPM